MPVMVLPPYKYTALQQAIAASVYGYDPYFEYVTFLSHFDGANNSTTYTATTGQTIGAMGTAVISTADSKFGTASLKSTVHGGAVNNSTGFTALGGSACVNFGANDFTVEAWVKPTDTWTGSGYSMTVATVYQPNQAGNGEFGIGFNASGQLNGFARQGSILPGTGSTVAALNQWHHVALVRNGTTVTGYLNGVPQFTITVTTAALDNPTNYAFSIGSNGNGYEGFYGFIDEVRVTNGAARYTSNFSNALPSTAFPDTMGAYEVDPWFDSVSVLMHGESLTESAANRTILASSGVSVDTTQKRFGSSSLKLTNGYISLDPTDVAWGTQDFTVEAWIYIAAHQSINQVFFAGPVANGSGDSNLSLYINASGTIVASTVGNQLINAGSAVPVNTWTHVAMTRNGNTLTTWRNGVAQGTNVGLTSTWKFNDVGCVIGSPQYPANMYIDELRVTKGVCRYFGTFVPRSFAFPQASLSTGKSYDPYLSSVKLQLRMEGAEGGTSFVDDAGHTVTVAGGVTTTATNNRAGGGNTVAKFVGGSSNYLSVPLTDFAMYAADFTLESWIYPTDITGTRVVLSNWHPNSAGGCAWIIQIVNGYLGFAWGAGNSNPVYTSTTGQMAVNNWYHVAVVRRGAQLYMFVNGTMVYTDLVFGTTAVNNGDVAIGIGNTAGGFGSAVNNFVGYIDDVRVTNGVARYTKKFTPPTTISATKSQVYATRYAADPFKAKTVAYLGFDGQGVADGTGKVNTTTVTVSGTIKTTDGSAVTSGALYSDGSAFNYVTLESPDNLTLAYEDFTIECFVKLNTASTGFTLLDGRPGGTNGNFVNIGYEPGRGFLCYYSTSYVIQQGATQKAGAWYHVVLQRAGSILTMFVNGSKVGTYNIGTNYVNFTYSRMALLFNTAFGSTGTASLNGYIDDFRITNGVARYLGNFDPALALPGGTYKDPYAAYVRLLMHGEDLTDVAGNTMAVTGNVTSSATQFKFGTKSISFSTAGSLLKTSVNPGLATGTQDFTLECWIYPTSGPFSQGSTILSWKDSTGSASTGHLGFNSTGNLMWATVAGQSSTDIIAPSSTWALNTWHHLAVVRSGNTISLYQNGVLRASGTNTNSFTAPNGLALGGRTDNNSTTSFVGYMDEVRLTVGVARYTGATYTVPTTQFPDN